MIASLYWENINSGLKWTQIFGDVIAVHGENINPDYAMFYSLCSY